MDPTDQGVPRGDDPSDRGPHADELRKYDEDRGGPGLAGWTRRCRGPACGAAVLPGFDRHTTLCRNCQGWGRKGKDPRRTL